MDEDRLLKVCFTFRKNQEGEGPVSAISAKTQFEANLCEGFNVTDTENTQTHGV